MSIRGSISRALVQIARSFDPQAFRKAQFGYSTLSGVTINEDTALTVNAVYACVRVIAETLASLPLPVYRRLEPRGKERAPEHPLYRILHTQPNPYMTSFTWRETMFGHVLLRGNCYSEIEWGPEGQIRALWPLRPDHTDTVINPDDGTLTYRTRIRGVTYMLEPRQVWHMPGLSFDGIRGYSVISLGREAVGLTKALEEYGASFFGNAANPGGVIKHPKRLMPDVRDRLQQDWENAHQGIPQTHRVAVLEDGMEWQQVGISPEDAQALESKKFQTREMARMFRVQPHKIQDLENATYTNIEHQAIEFVVDTIRPWAVRFEQVSNIRFFLPSDMDRYFAEFLLDGLLRGDTKSRYEAHAIARQNGVINADEWRELENMNPQPNGQGRFYLLPLNMVPAEYIVGGADVGELKPALSSRSRRHTAQAVALRRRITAAYRPVIRSAAERIIKRECTDILRLARKAFGEKGRQEFDAGLGALYEDLAHYAQQQIEPVDAGLAEAVYGAAREEIGATAEPDTRYNGFVKDYSGLYVRRHIARSRAAVNNALTADDPVDALEALFADWQERRPDHIAREEVVRAEGAFVRQAFAVLGVLALMWVASSGACPYCAGLDGRTVGIEGYFLSAGEEFKPTGAERPMVASGNLGHPPAHDGCECSLVSAQQ